MRKLIRELKGRVDIKSDLRSYFLSKVITIRDQQQQQQYQNFSTYKTMQSASELKSQNVQEAYERGDRENVYTSWSRDQLISRLIRLEESQSYSGNNLSLSPAGTLSKPSDSDSKNIKAKRRIPRPFDPTKYSTRLVAFKLAYFGKRYNGFEHHANNSTPLPTVEEELWKAFTKAKLIFPHPKQAVGNWEGCEYSKCGRTDRGVSAFGQVISLRVRSNRQLGGTNIKMANVERKKDTEICTSGQVIEKEIATESSNSLTRKNCVELAARCLRPSRVQTRTEEIQSKEDANIDHNVNFDSIADELPYVAILNRLLPSDIRILTWCPAPLDFSARFSCTERQYRYFFTQPCFLPIPHSLDPNYKPESTTKDGYLDITAMRAAAKLYEGLHDFRNLCKVDASKQLENFVRRIYHAGIEEVPDTTSTLEFLNSSNFQLPNHSANFKFPKIYAFILHGSAFLWHQVRHMMAILFLVGQGLEKPSIVTELLDVAKNPKRPRYQMAVETPLVLWDCIFANEDDPQRNEMLQWIYAGDTLGTAETKYGVPVGGLMDDLWRIWRERKIDETLSASLLGLVAGQGESIKNLKARSNYKGKNQKVFDGGDIPKLQGIYTPVMMKPVMDTVDAINQRYAIRKGFESAADLKQQGFRRLKNLGEDQNSKPDPPK